MHAIYTVLHEFQFIKPMHAFQGQYTMNKLALFCLSFVAIDVGSLIL